LKKIVCFVLIMILCASFAHSEDKASLKMEDTAPKFALKDPDDNVYSLDSIIGKSKTSAQALILIIGNRHTRENGNKWLKELDKLYHEQNNVEIFMVADLRGMPFFVTETLVKWGIKRERLPRPVLLDWEGKVNDLYKTDPGKSNMFLIDNTGKIKYIFVGKFNKDELETLNAKIQENIKKSLAIHKEIKK
jgi:predicted transcriptional regulator